MKKLQELRYMKLPTENHMIKTFKMKSLTFQIACQNMKLDQD